MNRFRLIGVALLAVFALSVVVASVAQAEEAPFWSIEGTRLAAGKTHFITAKVYKEKDGGTLTLTTPELGTVITCTGLSFPLKTGVILGSSAETPGTDNEVARFSGCTVSGNGEKCNVEENKEKGIITTKPIKSELVENAESGKVGKKLLTEFSPFTGEEFTTIEFKEETGGKCKLLKSKVTGSVAAEVLNSAEKAVELPNTLEQGTTWLTRFPSTEITHVWLVKAGTGKEVEVGPLVFDGFISKEVGTALVLLAKVTGTTLESEERDWSPLP